MSDRDKYGKAVDLYRDRPTQSDFVTGMKEIDGALSADDAIDIWNYIDAAWDQAGWAYGDG